MIRIAPGFVSIVKVAAASSRSFTLSLRLEAAATISRSLLRRRVAFFMLTLMVLLGATQSFAQDAVAPSRELVIVVGAEGEAEFGLRFREWGKQWTAAGHAAGFVVTTISEPKAEESQFEQLQKKLVSMGGESSDSVSELWLVLIGHGTFDGSQAKFNLQGKDVAASDVATWLNSRNEPTVIINCASASAPFAQELSGNNRIIVTSTKSGYEMSFSHFGQYLAEVISENEVDLDKDEQTSLLEAIVAASGKTSEFYEADSRLATEHPMVEDNGDGLGTPVEWFRGVRVTEAAKDGTPADGLRANQIFFAANSSGVDLSLELVAERNELERQLEELRGQRSKLTEDQYFLELETIMVRLANVYSGDDKSEEAGQ